MQPRLRRKMRVLCFLLGKVLQGHVQQGLLLQLGTADIFQRQDVFLVFVESPYKQVLLRLDRDLPVPLAVGLQLRTAKFIQ